jgi:hypothetical protein
MATIQWRPEVNALTVPQSYWMRPTHLSLSKTKAARSPGPFSLRGIVGAAPCGRPVFPRHSGALHGQTQGPAPTICAIPERMQGNVNCLVLLHLSGDAQLLTQTKNEQTDDRSGAILD